MSTADISEGSPLPDQTREIVVYSHSALIYWWPVWVLGYILAVVTYFEGVPTRLGDGDDAVTVIVHPSKNLGVIYTVVTLLVIVMTNATVRGLASAMVIVTLLMMIFAFAYFGLWDDIFAAVRNLAIYLNLGFYVMFSTAILIIWAAAFFVFDRLQYWVFRPGQAVRHEVFGDGNRTYDTHGMSVYKLRDDLFRHWILGLGSGDLHIATTGAQHNEFIVPNVMFIGWKLPRIQRLVAMEPDEFHEGTPVTIGEPG